jgi:hypothetical protein
MTIKNLVLRTVYIDPDVDDALRNQAFEQRKSKNDLMRHYIKLGMRMAAGAVPTVSGAYVPAVAAKRSAAAKKAPVKAAAKAHRPAAKKTGRTTAEKRAAGQVSAALGR